MRKALFVLAAVVALWLAPGALAAGWCGSGESTADRADVATGWQIHALVVQPSDGADNFAADANHLADDAASISSWWLGQDPTRVPRFDLATFSGVTCLDISYVRLPQPGASYTGSSAAFNAVLSQLQTAGFTSAYKDFYVLYDGPSVQQDVCGTGGGGFNEGQSFAMVWLAGCSGIPTDAIGAHELLHAFGALPAGAPHFCTPQTDPFGAADPGHPCDSATDVLYPAATEGVPLSSLVLDFNHDDYYGHSGAWNDMQDSVFLHHTDAAAIALSLALSGAGDVSSNLPGVDCTASCVTQWDTGSNVILQAEGTASTRFVRWSGGCTGAAPSCLLQLTAPVATTALFGPLTVPLKVTTSGKGTVKCSPACRKVLTAGSPLTLRAVAAKGWRFAGWGGACKGTKLTCSPPTDFAVSARANFKKR
jgi:Divergent InlB B-repeat domain